LARDQLNVARALALALAFSVPLTGCGRKGPLDPPPDTSVPTPLPPASQGSTFTNPMAPAGAAQPAPVQVQTMPPASASAPTRNKTFFLDPLIQ
jgi:predicted small lipoprotein YifL